MSQISAFNKVFRGFKALFLLFIFSFLLMSCSGDKTIKKSEIQPLKIINAAISKDIKKSRTISEPLFPTKDFTADDKKVVSLIEFAHLTGRHALRWEWYTPEGDLYQTTGNQLLKAPAKAYVKSGTAHHTIALKGRNALKYPGQWQVKIYLDDVLERTDDFFIHPPKEEALPDINFGDYHALVIGIDNYKELKRLKSACKDARAVADLLQQKYGFNVTLLLDATRSEIISALDRMRLQLNETDNLLIYYAGHGTFDEAADEGYWLPVNAAPLEVGTSEWLPHTTITQKLRAMDAKHVLVVADSCYAGKLMRDVQAPLRGIGVQKMGKTKRDYFRKMAAKRVRSVIVSGGMEPVVDSGGKNDHSIFAAAFMDVLLENDGIMDGTTLFSKLRRPVILESDQTPQYSDIRRAHHEGGDFLFVSQNRQSTD